jgi:hypothetical protein
MADETSEDSKTPLPEPKAGCGSRLLVLILFLCVCGLVAAIHSISQPQDLTDIKGYGSPTTLENLTVPRRDLREVLQNSIDRSFPVTLTEREINLWLNRNLTMRQGGLLSDHVTLKGVWVRLEDGRAEIVIEREIMARPFTISMFVQIEQLESSAGISTEVHLHGGPYNEKLPYPNQGGRFGSLRIPQGFLVLVLDSFRNLAAAFPEEVELAFGERMARYTIEKGRITLDPRIPTLEVDVPSSR